MIWPLLDFSHLVPRPSSSNRAKKRLRDVVEDDRKRTDPLRVARHVLEASYRYEDVTNYLCSRQWELALWRNGYLTSDPAVGRDKEIRRKFTPWLSNGFWEPAGYRAAFLQGGSSFATGTVVRVRVRPVYRWRWL